MMFCFEKLSVEHIPFVYDIRFSVNENLLLPHHIQYLQREQLISDIEQGGGWICRNEDKFVGVGFGVFIPDAIIGGLFVKPEYQSMGIGSKLLELVTNWFFDKDVQKITLTTDAGSKAEYFYNKRGWRHVGLDEFGQIEFVKFRGD
ncbi:UNVERIFIED_ORG: acetyltransferase (GNAT) family protein [Citrobacter freundii]